MCGPYETCYYKLFYEILGFVIKNEKTIFPKNINVNDVVFATYEFTIFNKNPKRTLEGNVNLPDFPNERFGVVLDPLKEKTLSFSVRYPGPVDCGKYFSDGKVDICVLVPNDFPGNITVRYFLPWSNLQDHMGGTAQLDGKNLLFSTNQNGVLINLGELDVGKHNVVFEYKHSKLLWENKKNEQSGIEVKDEYYKKEESNNTNQEVTASKPKDNVIAVEESFLDEKIEIFVVKDGSPWEGSLKIISPSGKNIYVPVKNGKTACVVDEIGDWKISFFGQERVISISEKPGEKRTEEKFTARLIGGVYPKSRSSDMDSVFVFLVVMPFLFFPIIGYLAFRGLGRRGIRLEKRYDGKKVNIKIENNGERIFDIRISDTLPRDADISEYGGGSVKSLLDKDIIRWRRPELGHGETLHLSYEIITMERPHETKLSAFDGEGNLVCINSETVPVLNDDE